MLIPCALAVVTVNAAAGGPEAVVSSDAFTELVPFEDTPSAQPVAPPFTPFISALRASPAATGKAPFVCAPPVSIVTAAPFVFAPRRAFFDVGCDPQQQPRNRNQILQEAHKVKLKLIKESVEHIVSNYATLRRCVADFHTTYEYNAIVNGSMGHNEGELHT